VTTHFSRLLRHAWVTVGLFLFPGHHTGKASRLYRAVCTNGSACLSCIIISPTSPYRLIIVFIGCILLSSNYTSRSFTDARTVYYKLQQTDFQWSLHFLACERFCKLCWRLLCQRGFSIWLGIGTKCTRCGSYAMSTIRTLHKLYSVWVRHILEVEILTWNRAPVIVTSVTSVCKLFPFLEQTDFVWRQSRNTVSTASKALNFAVSVCDTFCFKSCYWFFVYIHRIVIISAWQYFHRGQHCAYEPHVG
jgi:hypothetical protein